MNVEVQPELLRWARERASLKKDELAQMLGTRVKRAPIEEWEQTGRLPMAKLELLAAKTHTPFGMLFLPEPPNEPIPIQDFRQPASGSSGRPSTELLETIYARQFQQTWMRDHLQADGADPLKFVGSANLADSPKVIAQSIRAKLNVKTDELTRCSTPMDATLWLMGRVEAAGVIIQRSGIVGSNTHRRLNPDEFKGFALSDEFAPLIFVNGRDWHASQMFTVAHECAHIWLGTSGLPDGNWFGDNTNKVERFCNHVAAEVLMPEAEVRQVWPESGGALANAQKVSRCFRVSCLAALVRARTLNLIEESEFVQARGEEEHRFADAAPPRPKSDGGNWYRTTGTRLGKRFIREVLASTLEGKTLYSEAFDLLGTRKTSVFNRFVEEFLAGGRQ